jgi:hypothetical protein
MYDTYYIYINHIKELLQNSNNAGLNELASYVDRKLFKGMIMTYEYGIGCDTAFENFKNTLDSLPDNYFSTKYNVSDIRLRSLFKRWFRHIFELYRSYPIDPLLYKNNKQDLVKIIKEVGLLKLDDISMYVNYNLLKYNQLEVNNKGIRYTSGNVKRVVVGGVDLIDLSKTEGAAIVNCVHMLDAIYLRRIVRYLHNNYNINIVTIHDGFGIQFYSVDILLYAAVKSFHIHENLGLIKNVNINIAIEDNSPVLLF